MTARVPVRILETAERRGELCRVQRLDSGEELDCISLERNPPLPWPLGATIDIVSFVYPFAFTDDMQDAKTWVLPAVVEEHVAELEAELIVASPGQAVDGSRALKSAVLSEPVK